MIHALLIMCQYFHLFQMKPTERAVTIMMKVVWMNEALNDPDPEVPILDELPLAELLDATTQVAGVTMFPLLRVGFAQTLLIHFNSEKATFW